MVYILSYILMTPTLQKLLIVSHVIMTENFITMKVNNGNSVTCVKEKEPIQKL